MIDCDAFDVLHGSSLKSYVTLREVLRRLAPYDQPTPEQVPLPERLVSRLMAARAAAIQGGEHKQGLGS